MKKIYAMILGVAMAASASASVQGPYLDPQGERVVYKAETDGLIVFWGDISAAKRSSATEVIFGENNEVYIKVVPTSGVEGWVKGTKSGSTITVSLPQNVGTLIDPMTDEEVDVYANLLEYREDEEGYQWYYNAAGTSTVAYTLSDDGVISLNLKDENSVDNYSTRIIGIVSDLETDSQSWLGYGDWTEVYSPFNEQPLTLPEGLKAEEWMLYHEYEARPVSIAIDGNDIYLGNLTDELPDSYVKGTIDGETVTFPLTYLGYSEEMANFLYFVPAAFEEVYFPEYDDYFEEYVIQESYPFSYNVEEKLLENMLDYGAIMIGTSDKVGELAGSYLDFYFEPEISWVDPENANAPLQDPEFIAAYNFRDWFNCDLVEFFLPALNEEGYPLDTSRIYYVFYIDGEPLTLTPDVYVGLSEEMTEIPYDFYDEVNDDVICYGQEHQISVFETSYKTVGVKMFYRLLDGTVLETNYVEESIEELSNGEIVGLGNPVFEKAVKSVEYFDLQGRAVAAPSAGLYIKVVNYADGSRLTSKVHVRK